MCGIAAIFAYNPDAPGVNEGELVAIRDHMAARGPDAAGLWLDPARRIGLGHRRLSIIDVSAGGAQPMFMPERQLAIVFNGEIYNYRELRATLEQQDHQFRSTSDTEVLLHLYSEYGEAMLDQLRGMFTFAIWDGAKQNLFLARDPFGIKPLYWSDDGKTFRVASQVKALLAGGQVDTAPEPAGHVGFFLWGHVPAPYTLYRGIRNLTAGHCLTIDARGQKRLRSFCSIPGLLAEAEASGGKSEIRKQRSEIQNSAGQLSTLNSQPASDLLGAALRDTVRHHLIADVPVGVFLSAGLDSTTLAALAAEAGGQLRTVTLGFEEYRGTANDETVLAEEVARHYGANHTTIWVTRQDFENDLNRLLHAMDQPSTDGVNSYFISRAAAQARLKVALSGVGGDELFGSYPSFREIPRAVARLSPFAHCLPLGRAFRAVSAPVLKQFTSPKYAGLLEYGGTYGGAYLLRRGMFMPWELPEILDADLVRAGWNELQTLARLEETTTGLRSPHLKISALEMTWYMRHQLLRDTDWASMEHSLEVRTPLVDVALTRSLAPLFAADQRPTKRDMAQTPISPLPASILNRPKTGFVVPVRQWLLESSQPSTLNSQPASERGLRGWAKTVHGRFVADTVPQARRISIAAPTPSRPISPPASLRGVGHSGPEADLRPPTSDLRPPTSAPRRILVFRIGQLGDTVVSLPAMWAVRRQFPDAELTLLCDRHPDKNYVLGADLLRGSGLFNKFEFYPVLDGILSPTLRTQNMLGLLFRLRRAQYDTLVYLSPSARSRLQIARDRQFFRLAGIKNLIGMTGFTAEPINIPGAALPESLHEAEMLLDRLAASGLATPRPGMGCMNLNLGSPEVAEIREWLGALREDGGRPWIGFGPGSKMPAKRWPVERFAELGKALIEQHDLWPVVFGGGEDRDVGQELLIHWGRGYNAAGKLSLRGSAQALKRCALYVGNDTGTMHLAAAAGTRCVGIFSARDRPGRWNPYGPGHHVLRSEIECEGCGLTVCLERKNECLNRITVAQVLAACAAVLARNAETLKNGQAETWKAETSWEDRSRRPDIGNRRPDR